MIEWKISNDFIPLKSAIRIMEQRVDGIYSNKQTELIWMLEHPHVYSGGTSSKDSHLLLTNKVPVELTKRGGSYTYHGPGQRVIYVLLDLKKQGKDVRKFVWNLEQWIIDSLKEVGVNGERREKRIGIWVTADPKNHLAYDSSPELKIASIGLRIKKWISYFGVSINVNPDLGYFDGIVACGNKGYGVTSLHKEGVWASLTDIDLALKYTFSNNFKC